MILFTKYGSRLIFKKNYFPKQNQYRDLENAIPRAPSTSQLVAVNDHDDDGKSYMLGNIDLLVLVC